jgi:hypothetical protein
MGTKKRVLMLHPSDLRFPQQLSKQIRAQLATCANKIRFKALTFVVLNVRITISVRCVMIYSRIKTVTSGIIEWRLFIELDLQMKWLKCYSMCSLCSWVPVGILAFKCSIWGTRQMLQVDTLRSFWRKASIVGRVDLHLHLKQR